MTFNSIKLNSAKTKDCLLSYIISLFECPLNNNFCTIKRTKLHFQTYLIWLHYRIGINEDIAIRKLEPNVKEME